MTRFPSVSAIAAIVVVSLVGCSTSDGMLSSDKVDYRTSGGAKSVGLEVPPDLTQLTRDSRYQQVQSGSVSAAALQASAPAGGTSSVSASATPTPVVAATAVGAVSLERSGSDRWLHTTLAPEQLWPQLQGFWKDGGFVLVQDVPAAGVMETDWAENRGKLPQDFLRGTIGKLFDGAYSTGELDKFRTRVERVSNGSDIYISHRGMIEVYAGDRQGTTTVWQPRQADRQLEAELLSRLMLKLGATKEVAGAMVATAASPEAPARARMLPDTATPTLQVDDGFDRAWRRVGVALDRSGFTVEDRDRTQGLYFVRYVDPAFAGKEEPNFFQKLFSSGKKDDGSSPTRYRVLVKGDGDRSAVTVQNSQGVPEAGDVSKRITSLLLADLK